ncbi:MAG: hypothetical protein ABSF91_11475 [Bacteroidota bacterium]|jgi:hypothetical protein
MIKTHLIVGNDKIPVALGPNFSVSPVGLKGQIRVMSSQMPMALPSVSPLMAHLSIGDDAPIPVQIGMSAVAVSHGNKEIGGVFSVKTEHVSPLVISNITKSAALSIDWGETDIAVPNGHQVIKKRRFRIEPEDILSIGVLILMVGASIISVLMAIFMGLRMIEPQYGMKIILGCVSGAAVSAVVRGFVFKHKKRKGDNKFE